MRSLCLRWIVSILACLLSLSACGAPTPAATPLPAATPPPATATPLPPTVTPTPEATATPAPELSLPGDWVAFTDEERGLVIHHPGAWEVSQPTAENLAALLQSADAALARESVQRIIAQLLATPEALERFAALGFLFDNPTGGDGHFVSNFSAIVTAADGLTLDTYTELVAAQMGRMQTLAVENAQVESALRPGGLDVASLRYTLDGAAFYGLSEGTTIRGWQVAFYDRSGEELLILSLTGADEKFPALEEMFRVLIANVEFE